MFLLPASPSARASLSPATAGHPALDRPTASSSRPRLRAIRLAAPRSKFRLPPLSSPDIHSLPCPSPTHRELPRSGAGLALGSHMTIPGPRSLSPSRHPEQRPCSMFLFPPTCSIAFPLLPDVISPFSSVLRSPLFLQLWLARALPLLSLSLHLPSRSSPPSLQASPRYGTCYSTPLETRTGMLLRLCFPASLDRHILFPCTLPF